VSIGLRDEPVHGQKVAKDAHGSLGDTSPGSQFRSSHGTVMERIEDAEFDTCFERGAALVCSDGFPYECRIRL
jgi:hypothetical protein